MEDIWINLSEHWNFSFCTSEYGGDIFRTENLHCYNCSSQLNRSYSFIITQLEEAGLLAPEYKPVCCYCKVLKEYGLLELYDILGGFIYSELEDILLMRFSKYILHEGQTEFVELKVRIHDWSKINED